MKKINLILLLAALMPIALFFLPMWTIDFGAPQFPEGLQMRIYIDKVTGDDNYELKSINLLNHYIGMKEIKPDSIPELRYMPVINIIMIVTGVIFAFLRKKALFITWLVVFSILGALGLYDFYVWQTDFATDLDPNAILKATNVSYQPPLIGSRKILNFTVTSLPGIGGFVLFAAIAGGWLKVFFDYFKSHRKKLAVAIPVLTFSLLSCSPEPEDIKFGHDECVLCKMSITDHKYGAEIVNKKGKVFKFDALECMAKYLNDKQIEYSNVHSIWTVDYSNPGQLIDAKNAFYLRSKSLPSPMAMFLTSFADKNQLITIKEEHPGEMLNWENVSNLVREEWP